MLVSITDKCRMGCIHCMDDARADGSNFMDYDTWLKVIDFNFKYDKILVITGGEPTEHPRFWEYLSILAPKVPDDYIVTITTNGMNLDKDTGSLKEGIEKISSMCKGSILWQVTHDDRYYPIKINENNPIFKLPGFSIEHDVRYIVPVGRALTNNIPYNHKYLAPKCFNIRSIIRTEFIRGNTKSLQTAINSLRSMDKMCTPQIAYDGSIKLGESLLCPTVAHISDSEEEICKKIFNFKCGGCQIGMSILSLLHKAIIGEM